MRAQMSCRLWAHALATMYCGLLADPAFGDACWGMHLQNPWTWSRSRSPWGCPGIPVLQQPCHSRAPGLGEEAEALGAVWYQVARRHALERLLLEQGLEARCSGARRQLRWLRLLLACRRLSYCGTSAVALLFKGVPKETVATPLKKVGCSVYLAAAALLHAVYCWQSFPQLATGAAATTQVYPATGKQGTAPYNAFSFGYCSPDMPAHPAELLRMPPSP